MVKSFYSWLLQFENEDSSVGDLARDAKKDEGFPRRSTSEKYIRKHLEKLSACNSVLKIFDESFKHYEIDAK